MVACSDTKGRVRERKEPPTPTIKTTTNDGRVWQLEVSCEKEILGYYSFDKHGTRRAAEKTNKQKLQKLVLVTA